MGSSCRTGTAAILGGTTSWTADCLELAVARTGTGWVLGMQTYVVDLVLALLVDRQLRAPAKLQCRRGCVTAPHRAAEPQGTQQVQPCTGCARVDSLAAQHQHHHPRILVAETTALAMSYICSPF